MADSILHMKYEIRRDGATDTIVWRNENQVLQSKPATPAESHLAWQNRGLISALQAAMRKLAKYDAEKGNKS